MHDHGRRDLLRAAASAFLVLTVARPKATMAAAVTSATKVDNINAGVVDDLRFAVTTTLPKGYSPRDTFGPSSELVITVKPAVTYRDQIPPGIADASLAATGHWVPIVLRSRQSCQKCYDSLGGGAMLTTTLTKDHMTPEGGSDSNLWWKELPLIVTAKLNVDGKNAKPGPNDLVGCRILPRLGDGGVALPLRSRGICQDMLSSSSSSIVT